MELHGAKVEYYTFTGGHSYPDSAVKISQKVIGKLYPARDSTWRTTEWDDKTSIETGMVLKKFNQNEFVAGEFPNGLNNVGYMYYPEACATGTAKCPVHFFLHGCGGSCLNT